MLELRLQHFPSPDDVLLPPLLLEPLFYLGACRAALCKVEPVPAGARGVLGGAYLHYISVLQHVVIGHYTAVHLGPHHAVAHVGVDVVGKVYGSCTGRQVYHVPFGREHEDLVGEHVYLQIVEEVLSVGLLLVFQQPAHPGELVLIPLPDGGSAAAHLVFPMGGDAVFGGVMHLPGAYLHLEGYALAADDGGVYALVHVGLGGGYIVLEAPGHRVEHVVDNAQHIVAVRDIVHYHPEGAEVENAVDVQLLGVHFPVDAVHMLYAAVDGGLDAFGVQPRLYLLLHAFHKAFQLVHLLFKGRGYLIVPRRVQVLERQILQLPFGPLHAQTVGNGGVDFHGLQGFGALLLRGLVGHGAHIVQPVGYFYQDDPDVLGHGHEHLPQILHLLVFLAGVLHTGQLCDALHYIRHRRAELTGDVGVGEVGVLDDVVEQGRDHRVLVHAHVHGDVRCGHTVGHIGRAVLPELSLMGALGHFIGLPDTLQVHSRAVFAYLFYQVPEHLIRVQQSILFFSLLIHIRTSQAI